MPHAGDVSIVDVSLITICVESLLYGIVCVLFATSAYLHIDRQRSIPSSQMSRPATKPPVPLRAIFSPIFVGSILIYIFVTGHWTTNVYRLFQAFKLSNEGKTPAALYLNLSQTTHVVKSAFLLSAALTGDATLIYRLYIVWNFSLRVIVIPILTFIGLAACGIGLEYQFSQFEPGAEIFNSSVGRWIITDIVFTICTNAYCTVLITFRIWSISASSKKFGGRNLMSISAMIVESAAIYTVWSVVFLAVYESHSTIQFFTVDTLAQISAIATLLINVRVGLGWAHKSGDDLVSTIKVNFRQEISHHNNPTSISNDFELETIQGHWPGREGIGKA